METLLYYSQGACSLTEIIVLEWLGQPYRLCRVERAERASDAYLKINPLGAVPALRVEDGVLVENSAILLYLCLRQPKSDLIPKPGSWEFNLLNQRLSYLGSRFHVAFYPYFMPQNYVDDPSLYPEIKDSAVESIQEEAAFVNGLLKDREFFLGSKRSVLDAYLYAMSRWAKPLFNLPQLFPNLASHQERMEKDPAVRFGLEIEKKGADVKSRGPFLGHMIFPGTDY